MTQSKKLIRSNLTWWGYIAVAAFVSVGASTCSVGPDSVWVLEEAELVALEVRRVGSSVLLAGDPFSAVDDTVTIERGAQLQLTAISLGSSSCRRGELYHSQTTGNNLTITLIDSVLTGPGVACTDDLAQLRRDILHELDAAGTTTVTVKGNPDTRVTFNVAP